MRHVLERDFNWLLANATDREIVDEVSFAILCEYSSIMASFPLDILVEDLTEKKRGRSWGGWRPLLPLPVLPIPHPSQLDIG